jgi:hypothetical protein
VPGTQLLQRDSDRLAQLAETGELFNPLVFGGTQRATLKAKSVQRAALESPAPRVVRETMAGDPVQPPERLLIAAPAKPRPIGKANCERLGNKIHRRLGIVSASHEEPQHLLGMQVVKARDSVGIERHLNRTTLLPIQAHETKNCDTQPHNTRTFDDGTPPPATDDRAHRSAASQQCAASRESSALLAGPGVAALRDRQ